MKRLLATIFSLLLLPTIASAQVSGSLWKLSSSSLLPINTSWSLTIPQLGGSGTRCLQVDNTGLVSIFSGGCSAGGGGSDPFYHPATGQSATTSTMLLFGNASTTQFTATSSIWFTGLTGGVIESDANGKLYREATSSSSAAGTLVVRDANQNAFAQNFVSAATSFPTNGGTVSLTNASPRTWIFNGSNTQTMKLPNATTLTIGTTFSSNNNSTGAITVVDNGSNVLAVVPPGGSTIFVASSTANANGVWDAHAYLGHTNVSGTSVTGFATSTPNWGIVIATTTGAQLGLTDDGTNEWALRAVGGALYVATSTYSATSSKSAFYLDTNGTPTFSALPTGCVLSTAGTLSVVGTTCNSGTVTSITAGTGLTGGTITTSGTIALDLTAQNIWTGASTTFTGGITINRATTTSATTTNFGFTNLPDAVLSTNHNGVVVATTSIGYNYITGGPTGANPTASVGLSATNGSAATFMRSDAAPALDQSIAPTWTGRHTFNVSPIIGTLTSGILVGSNNLIYASSTNQDTIVGILAGGSNATTSATAQANTFVGYQSGSVGTGANDSFLGYESGQNSSGSNNTYIGNQSGSQFSNSGGSNTAVGVQSLFDITSGINNSVLGFNALSGNTTGSNNVAIGYKAGLAGASVAYASSTFVGALTNFAPNAAIVDTTEFGAAAGYNNTGWDSTFLGEESGQNNTSGNNNIAIGFNALLPSATNNNQINLGNILFATNTAATSSSVSAIPTPTGSVYIASSSVNNVSTPTTFGVQNSTSANNILQLFSSTGAPKFAVSDQGAATIATSTSALTAFGIQGNNIGTTTISSGAQMVNTAASSTSGSGAITIDWNTGNQQVFLLTGNTTFTMNSTSSHPVNGGYYSVYIQQDGSGSRTVTWASANNIRWSNGTTTVSSAANSCTLIGFHFLSSPPNEPTANLGIYLGIASSTATACI